jgi:hypothetical protein
MITPSFNITATERVLPKLALDFTTASLDPRITFTRAGNTATVINSLGLIAPINADLPRFDFNPVTLACRGLLIEESRTNLVPISSNFSSASWSAFVNKTITSNSTTSPDGTVNATTLSSPAGNGIQYQGIAISANTTYTGTVFAKAINGTQIRCQLVSSGGAGVVYNQLLTISSGVNFGDGWYRLSFSLTTATGDTQIQMRLITDTSGNPVYIWGAQLETGAFATSYIPTVASQVTRNADVATMTGTNFSDWFNATEGTFVSYSVSNSASTASTRLGIAVSDGTSANRMVTVIGSATQTRSIVTASSSLQADLYSTVTSVNNTQLKTALGYKTDNFLSNANAGTTQSDTLGTVPTVTTAYLGASEAGTNTFMLNGTIQKIFYYPQCLTSAEVQAFTK